MNGCIRAKSHSSAIDARNDSAIRVCWFCFFFKKANLKDVLGSLNILYCSKPNLEHFHCILYIFQLLSLIKFQFLTKLKKKEKNLDRNVVTAEKFIEFGRNFMILTRFPFQHKTFF